MDADIVEKINYYNMASESNLLLSEAEKAFYGEIIEQAFSQIAKPARLVPDDFVDYCDDVSFLELYENWKSIPYYELWYERACMTFLLPQGLLYILPAILHTMVKRAYSREIAHRLINAIALNVEKSIIVTKNQYQIIEKVLFSPEEDIGLHAENCFGKEDCFGNNICEQINKARQVFQVL